MRRQSGNLFFARENGGGTSQNPDCGDVVSVPSEYIDVGAENTDTVIFVLSSDNTDCEGALAYASHCQVDEFDRPIFGYIQMCAPSHQPKTLPGQVDEDFHTAIHEISHILGMSSALFPLFRDLQNQPITLRCPEVYAGGTQADTGLFYEGDPIHWWKGNAANQVPCCCGRVGTTIFSDLSWHKLLLVQNFPAQVGTQSWHGFRTRVAQNAERVLGGSARRPLRRAAF